MHPYFASHDTLASHARFTRFVQPLGQALVCKIPLLARDDRVSCIQARRALEQRYLVYNSKLVMKEIFGLRARK